MKIVFSRKGFDSRYGKMASPILEDGSLLPLPIPSAHDSDTMASIPSNGVDLDGMLHDLSRGRHSINTRIHHDPELQSHRSKAPGWRPALGQTGRAHSHLAKRGVGPGDLFLFFGWFRQVERVAGRWRYAASAPDLHVLFGWLEVEDVLPIVLERDHCLAKYPAIASHAHVASPERYNHRNNHLYIGSAESRFLVGRRGGGYFGRLGGQLQLTAPGRSRTFWQLPIWMHPGEARRALSCHDNPARWTKGDEHTILESVPIGQEFVLDCTSYPEAEPWAAGLVSTHGVA